MLSKLYASPSTSITSSILEDGFLPILPVPMIFPLVFPPNVTWPFLVSVNMQNLVLSPVICLEQPLSIYHMLFMAARHSYKYNQTRDFGTQTCLGPFLSFADLSRANRHLRIHIYFTQGDAIISFDSLFMSLFIMIFDFKIISWKIFFWNFLLWWKFVSFVNL